MEEARGYVQQQPVVNVDETGWKESPKKAWLWVGVTRLVTVFMVRLSRGGKVASELLGRGYAGVVGSDRWSGSNWVDVKQRQVCWAHLVRDFQVFVDRGGESARVGKGLLSQAEWMFRWWHRVRDGTLNRSSFRVYVGSVRRRVGDLLREGEECSHPKTAQTCTNLLKVEGALWTFVRREGVEPTNNAAERAVRPGVLWRKGSFGTQSARGSRSTELTSKSLCGADDDGGGDVASAGAQRAGLRHCSLPGGDPGRGASFAPSRGGSPCGTFSGSITLPT